MPAFLHPDHFTHKVRTSHPLSHFPAANFGLSVSTIATITTPYSSTPSLTTSLHKACVSAQPLGGRFRNFLGVLAIVDDCDCDCDWRSLCDCCGDNDDDVDGDGEVVVVV